MNDPDKIRQRIIKISGLNGWSILIVAGLFAVISLLMGDGLGVFVGVAVLISPVMELKGRSLLKQGSPGARQWFSRSQLWLLSVIIIYCVWQLLGFFYFSSGVADLPPDVREALFAALSVDEATLNAMVGKIYLSVYLTIIFVSVLYQGGLLLYYRRHVPAIKPEDV